MPGTSDSTNLFKSLFSKTPVTGSRIFAFECYTDLGGIWVLLIRKSDQFLIKLRGLFQKQAMATLFESNDV
jgi:hypothetical protein